MTTQSVHKRGFTLVEVLVSIAIVLVLAGIVFTLAGPARLAARRSAEVQNLRQHFIALTLYREEAGPKVEEGLAQDMGLPSGRQVLFSPEQVRLPGLSIHSFQTKCPHPIFFRWGVRKDVSLAYLASDDDSAWLSTFDRQLPGSKIIMYSQACNTELTLQRYKIPDLQTFLLHLDGHVSTNNSIEATYYE